jgi:hypothetical protein
MSDALKNTSWPTSAISVEAQKLIGQFYDLVDDTSPSAGPELASKIFTKDGVMKAAAGKFEGSSGNMNHPADIALYVNAL